MAVETLPMHPGFALAYDLKIKELQAKYPVDKELGQWVKDSIISPYFPNLVDKQVVVVFQGGVLALHVNVPDSDPVPEAASEAVPAELIRDQAPENPTIEEQAA